MLTNENIKYFDITSNYYLLIHFPKSNLEIFSEFGFLNGSHINSFFTDAYSDHLQGSNIGLRKKGLFNNENLFFGIEYLRLLQSNYFNILPSPNWYDNPKYNFSSYRGHRWGAHSGSDSDDLLVFIGYSNPQITLTYGFNYERHGVTYNFPQRLKSSLEYRYV